MEDSAYYRIDWYSHSKLRQMLISLLVAAIVIVLALSPDTVGSIDLMMQLLLAGLGVCLFLLFWMHHQQRETNRLLFLTDTGKVTVIDGQGSGQNLDILAGNWVLFHCVILNCRDRLTLSKTRFVIFSDQVAESDWRRLRRAGLRMNSNPPS